MPLDDLPRAARPENDTPATAAPGTAPTTAPTTAPAISAEDRAMLLDAVQAFSRQEIAVRRPRPEQALNADSLRSIALAARDAGLLAALPEAGDNGGHNIDGDDASAAFAFWSLLPSAEGHDTGSTGFTLAALQHLAADDAAAAWHLHALALAQTAARLAGIHRVLRQADTARDGADNENYANTIATPFPADTVFTLDGSNGIGRSALGRLLAGQPLQASDIAILADTFGDRARTALVAAGTGHVAALRWQDGAMHLQLHDIACSSVRTDDAPHGLDGCHAVQWIAGPQPLASAPLSRAALAGIVATQQLAQVAIARGALVPAARRAHDYARLRKQGARTIALHDVVAVLLADIDTACDSVDLLLQNAGNLDAARAIALRREAMPLLARAANAAMQVHGGIGYMRDTGIEHVLRAVNTLRLVGGAPPELALVAAAMKAHAGDVAVASPDDEAIANDHLPGHLPASHRLSPATALRGVPLLRLLAPGKVLDPWELDTQSLPRPLANLRRRVRAFAERECAPIAAAADLSQRAGHETTPALQTLVQRAARAGLLTDILPAPLGSAPPAQFLHSLALQQALRVEELARVDGGLMLLLSAHALGLCPLLLSGDISLLRRVVLPAFRKTQAGDPQVFAFAITEPAAGSDAEDGHGALHQLPGVRARPAQNDGKRNGKRGWLLRGRKVFISGGDIARYVSVFAALEGEGYDSWTCFLVDTQAPGIRVSRCEMKMGMRASGAAELEFDDCFVPEDRIVGGLRNGWALARATLNLSRLPVAAMAVGFAQQAVDIATEFACRETLAGRPLVHYQQVQSTLADLQAETGAIRQLVWHHARSWRPRQDGAALCKFQATDRAQVVIETAMDLLGSAAIRHDQRIERTFRDIRLTRIFEGTNQINRLAVIEEQQSLLLARMAGHGR